MGKEIEYKLRASSRAQLYAAYTRLKADCKASADREVQMHTRYFDVPQRYLRERRWMLRIRQEDDRQILTFKTPGDGHCRGEWSVECSAAQPESKLIQALVQLGAPEELCQMSGFYVTCEARFVRLCSMLTLSDGTKVEIAADAGQLLGQGTQETLCELELELYEGCVDSLAELAAKTGLPEEPLSKAARALRLAENAAVKSAICME